MVQPLTHEPLTTGVLERLQEAAAPLAGAAAAGLAGLLGVEVNLQVVGGTNDTRQVCFEGLGDGGVVIESDYAQGLSGSTTLLLRAVDARALAGYMLRTDQPPESVDELVASALTEAASISLGAAMTQLSQLLGTTVQIEPPRVRVTGPPDEPADNRDDLASDPVVVLELELTLADQPAGNLRLLISPSDARGVAEALGGERAGESSHPTSGQAQEVAEASTGSHDAGAVMPALDATALDALAEMANITMGAAATALSTITGRKVRITTPSLSTTTWGALRQGIPLPSVVVDVNYEDAVEARNVLMIQEEDACRIVGRMMGNDQYPTELDEIGLSGIGEAMNQMMGNAATALSDFIGDTVELKPPSVRLAHQQDWEAEGSTLGGDDQVVAARFSFWVEDLLESALVQAMPLAHAHRVAAALGSRLEQGRQVESGSQVDVPADATMAAGQQPRTTPIPTAAELEAEVADALAEVGNMSMGAAATALSLITGITVRITTPEVTVASWRELRESFPVPMLVAEVGYSQGCQGGNILLIREDDACKIVGQMLGGVEPPSPLDDIGLSAVAEAMNQMVGASATALSELLATPVVLDPPRVYLAGAEGWAEGNSSYVDSDRVVTVGFRFVMDGLLDSTVMQIMAVDDACQLAGQLIERFTVPAVTSAAEATASAAEEWAVNPEAGLAEPEPPAAEALFEDSVAGSAASDPLHMVGDVAVRVRVVLSRMRLTLGELRSLSGADVLGMSAQVGQPAELLIGNRRIGWGEVICSDGRYGFRIQSLSPEQLALGHRYASARGRGYARVPNASAE